MTRSLSLVFLLLAISSLVSAQTKMLTVEEGTSMNRKLFPQSLPQIQWRGESELFAWVSKGFLITGTPEINRNDTILDLSELNQSLRTAGRDTLSSFPGVSFDSEHTFTFWNKSQLYRFNTRENKVYPLNSANAKAENSDVATVTNHIAYTIDNNLFVSVDGKEIRVNSEEREGLVFGKTVHRNEFGINKGTFWSPDGTLLAFYRMDESMVTQYPLVDISTRIAEPKPVRYPMAGMKSHEVTVGVFDPLTGKTVFLKTGEPADQYLTNITWSPDSKSIYIAILNRDQNHMMLNRYDAATGNYEKTLFEERDNEYVEPLNGPFFIPGNNDLFIWQSQRDGYNHLYLYNTEGILVRQLTKGPWVVKDIAGFNPDASILWFTANKSNPLETRFYSCVLRNGEVRELTPDEGTHRVLPSHSGKYFIDIFNSHKIASQVNILDPKGKTIRVILENINPLADYKLGETSVFTLKGEDQSDLYCRVIKPVDFDPEKKYPVFIYVYGGPHSQLITNSWLAGAGLFLNYVASRGYVVFTLDNRGTGNRGIDFEQAIFRDLGTKEVADQMKGVEWLKAQNWVDTARIGVNGWSYGGFLTLSMVARNPGVFKVAVAGGPVVDWKYYEVMYGERYMDTPEANPDGYVKASLLKDVQNLKSKILIIHGQIDETVVPQNSLSLLKKCVDEGIQIDFFLYPGHEHNVRGKDRVHLNTKILNYFEDYL